MALRFARSSGGSVSSADSISADWCVNSWHKALMWSTAIEMSLTRCSTRCTLRGSMALLQTG